MNRKEVVLNLTDMSKEQVKEAAKMVVDSGDIICSGDLSKMQKGNKDEHKPFFFYSALAKMWILSHSPDWINEVDFEQFVQLFDDSEK